MITLITLHEQVTIKDEMNQSKRNKDELLDTLNREEETVPTFLSLSLSLSLFLSLSLSLTILKSKSKHPKKHPETFIVLVQK